MSLAGNLLDGVLARQYAWNLHRFSESARETTEFSIGFVALILAIFTVTILVLPALLFLEVRHLYIAVPAALLVCWFWLQRRIGSYFAARHDDLLTAAIAINEDSAKGPSWAIRRQLLAATGSVAILAVTLILLRSMSVQFDLVADPDRFQHLAQASQFYRTHQSGLDNLADRFDSDAELVEIACDPEWMEMRLAGQEHLQPMSAEYLAIYEPLCDFTNKVSMRRTARGTRVPYHFYEHGDLFVLVFLDRRRDAQELYPACTSDMLHSPVGRCDVPLNQSWSVTYTWDPF